jgi:hypothetical protein
MRRLVTLGIVLVAALAPARAHAHARSTSFSYWDEADGKLHGQILFPWVELQQAFPEWRTHAAESVLAMPHDAEALTAFFAKRIRVEPAGACTEPVWSRPVAVDATVRFDLHAACAAPVESVRFDLTFDVAPSHVHLVRFEREGAVISGVVTSSGRDWAVAGEAAASPGTGFAAFVKSGFAHILAGPDHLAFLLALLLLATSLGSLAWLATGFTLAHSASLAIAVYGLSRPHGPTIEALIGFTVAFSALEVFLAVSAVSDRYSPPVVPRRGTLSLAVDSPPAVPRRGTRQWGTRVKVGFVVGGIAAVVAAWFGVLHVRTVALTGVVLFCASFLFLADEKPAWRWLLVFLFGFVHGFGFAGPLLEMQLDRADTAKALLGFNLGVEGGQIVFLAVVWPVVALLTRKVPRARLAAALAAGVLAAGLQWFLVRAM